ncbi:hypothetical protein GXW83_01805 [Streptacidiphilus sp. PB12-B1b]|uniref:DUF6299 family protein n=1 Tax=Streptacidiphilus sp. PB12-B1b TaxID=2705012 RepID=UPI0015FDE446|nr:DUF6299 family protein [Streptacidiphilus sp. PB12-B1b]QMU74703.1 hypothetical protein GXW83_01805 [Streptacidiphilus sp. PB12-B1b]
MRATRWAALAAGAGVLVAMGAGTAAADDGQVGVAPFGAVTASGQVTLSGTYTCDPWQGPYAQIEVSVSQQQWDGTQVDAVTYDRVACTGSPQLWQETVTAPAASDAFTPGQVQADVAVWTAGNWNGRVESWQQVGVS